MEHLLLNLGESKASGPDGISATMLRHTATSIAPSVTALFNLSIQTGQVIGFTNALSTSRFVYTCINFPVLVAKSRMCFVFTHP